MKKRISAVLIFVLIAGTVFSLSGCGVNAPSKAELSQLAADAILSDNAGLYYGGECCGEGHKILGSSLSGSQLKVYALTTFGNYGFQNDMLIKISGSGVIPAVLTFEKDGTEYRLLEIEYPRDGADYADSIKRMFPPKYRAAALNCDSAYDELVSQERTYAEEYLQSIGREADIGEYRDLDIVLLTDLGISVEVSNRLSCNKNLGDYPYWTGSSEYLENGIRYVRSLSYDEAAGLIIYTTVEKGSGETVECFVFDAATGEPRTDAAAAGSDACPRVTINGITYFDRGTNPLKAGLPPAHFSVYEEAEIPVEGALSGTASAYAVCDDAAYLLINGEWYEFIPEICEGVPLAPEGFSGP